MALFSHLFTPRICVAYQSERPRLSCNPSNNIALCQIHGHAAGQGMKKSDFFGLAFTGIKMNHIPGFVGVPRIPSQPNPGSGSLYRRNSVVSASWLASSQIASSAFTVGTVAVLPFYTAMVVAPKCEFTKKLMANSIPYIALGLLYAFLLYQSWTPETMHLMFANEYWLPELSGIGKLFSSEMTLSSAWIHLLAIDLFAARQIYFDGLKNNLEMRHSITLCLLFCPIGVLVHFITKSLTPSRGHEEGGIPRPLDNK